MPSIIHQITFYLFVLSVFLSTSLALFAGLGLVPLFFVMACPSFLYMLYHKRFHLWYNSSIKKIILLFFTYALISTTWTIVPMESFLLWCRLLIIYLFACSFLSSLSHFTPQQKKVVMTALIMGVILTFIFSGIELITHGALTSWVKSYNKAYVFNMSDLNRGVVFLSICSWALFMYFSLQRQWAMIGIFGGLLLFFIISFESQSAFISMICAIIAAAIVSFLQRRGVTIITAGTLFIVFAIPAALIAFTPQQIKTIAPDIAGASQEHRILIWDFVANEALKKPLFGYGLDSSRHIPIPEERMIHFPGQNHLSSPLPLHPHNYELQLWLELGIVGLIWFAAFMYTLLRTIDKQYPSLFESVFMVGLFINFFGIGQFAFGIWQYWWVTGGVIALGLLRIAVSLAEQYKGRSTRQEHV